MSKSRTVKYASKSERTFQGANDSTCGSATVQMFINHQFPSLSVSSFCRTGYQHRKQSIHSLCDLQLFCLSPSLPLRRRRLCLRRLLHLGLNGSVLASLLLNSGQPCPGHGAWTSIFPRPQRSTYDRPECFHYYSQGYTLAN